jgi:hypothetical protein
MRLELDSSEAWLMLMEPHCWVPNFLKVFLFLHPPQLVSVACNQQTINQTIINYKLVMTKATFLLLSGQRKLMPSWNSQTPLSLCRRKDAGARTLDCMTLERGTAWQMVSTPNVRFQGSKGCLSTIIWVQLWSRPRLQVTVPPCSAQYTHHVRPIFQCQQGNGRLLRRPLIRNWAHCHKGSSGN